MRSDLSDFKPTAECINALPEPLRVYIRDIETMCDPSGYVQENTLLRDTVSAQEARILELEKALALVLDWDSNIDGPPAWEVLDLARIALGRQPREGIDYPANYETKCQPNMPCMLIDSEATA